MKILSLLILISSFVSCTRHSERNLYNENDPEWSDILALAQEECVAGSNFFDDFDTQNEFDNVPFAVGDIFKIVQDDNDATEIFVKVDSINANDMTLIFNSDDNALDMILTFEENDHQDLGTFLKAAVCNPSYDDYFSGISGLSGEILYYTWFKETIDKVDGDDDDDIADEYRRRSDKFIVNTNYPSILYYFNGTRTKKFDNDGDDDENDEQSSVSNLTITDVTSADECDSGEDDYDSDCEFASVTRNCSVSVDTTAYTLRPFDSTALTLAGVGCELLESAD